MSHHYSGPDYGFPHGDARLDLTDLYAFPKPGGAGKSIIIMNVHPSVAVNPPGPTTAEAFAPEAIYELKIDTNRDAVADIAYRVRFSLSQGGVQTATVYRVEGQQAAETGTGGQIIIEGAPVSIGMEAQVAEAGEYRLFAGWRSDPFFFDTEGALNNMQFTGTDFFTGKDVCSIVLEIPDAALGTSKVGLWHRTVDGSSGKWVQADRGAKPSQSVFLTGESKADYLAGEPVDDARFIPIFAHSLEHTGGYTPEEATRVAGTLLPDILYYDPRRTAAYPENGQLLAQSQTQRKGHPMEHPTFYRTIQVDGLSIFYREAGPKGAPTLLLLHGLPSSSRMFEPLFARLSDRYHLVAPDYPGFGHSDWPDPAKFAYTFDHCAEIISHFTEELGLSRYTLYMQDYGGPVGFRMALAHPDRVEALIVQDAVSHNEGLGSNWATRRAFWADRPAHEEALRTNLLSLATTKTRHIGDDPNTELYDPDLWTDEYAFLSAPGQAQIQSDLFYDYRTNVDGYPKWQAWMQKTQPRLLVIWGKHDLSFDPDEPERYRKDVPKAQVHVLDAGHFALDTKADEIAALIRDFMKTLK